MKLIKTIKVSLESNCYLFDGVIARDGDVMCFTSEDKTIKIYDTHTASHIFSLGGHSNTITDIVTTPFVEASVGVIAGGGGVANTNVIFTSQCDTGVMVTDLRVGKAVRFLDELVGTGQESYSLSVSPSGNSLALAVNGDLHLIDTRNWCSFRSLRNIHNEEITRVRYCGESWVCSGGEDMLLCVMDLGAPDENDMMLDVINVNETVHKLQWFPQHDLITATGSMENNWLIPLRPGSFEVSLPRVNFDSYSVDFVSLNSSTLSLVRGSRSEDKGVGPLEVVNCMTDGGVGNHIAFLGGGHSEIARVALTVRNRLITAGEDGAICIWDTSNLACPFPVPPLTSSSSSSSSSSSDAFSSCSISVNNVDITTTGRGFGVGGFGLGSFNTISDNGSTPAGLNAVVEEAKTIHNSSNSSTNRYITRGVHRGGNRSTSEEALKDYPISASIKAPRGTNTTQTVSQHAGQPYIKNKTHIK